MAAFHIDTDGNIWIGQNTSDVFSTALTQTDPNDSSLPRVKFYVTKEGALNAISGEIGGIVIDADGIESDNYDESSKTGWRLDNADGVGNYFDINIILPTSLSDNPSTGRTTLDFGNSKIFDYNNDLFLEANDDVIVKSVLRLGYASDGLSEPRLLFGNSASSAGSQINPIMGIESTLVSADTYGGSSGDLARELNFSNGSSTPIMTMNSENALVEFTGDLKLSQYSDIYIGTDRGSNGEVLMKQNGDVVWGTLSSGISISGSGDITVSESNNAYTISHDDNDHSFVNHVDTSSGGDGGTDALTISGTGIRVNFGTTSTRVAVGNHNHDGVYSTGAHLQLATSGGTNGTSSSASRSDHNHGTSTHTHTSVLSFSANEINIYGSVKPSSNNNRTIGTSSSLRFADMYSQEFYGQYFYGTLINSSSENVKTNIADTGLGLDFIEALPIKQFNYITEGHSDKKYTGVIAEDVQDILDANGWDDYYLVVDNSDNYRFNNRCQHPAICTCGDEDCGEGNYSCQGNCCSSYFKYTEEDGTVTNWVHHTVEECEAFEVDGNRHPHFNYYQLVGPLVKAVQELSTQISDLTARVELLEG